MDHAVRLGNGPTWDDAHSHQVAIHPTRLLLFSSTADGRMNSLSPTWEKLCGAPPATLLGHGWLERLHPDDREPLLRVWQQARQEAQPFRQHLRLRDRHGRYLRMLIDAAPAQPTGDEVAPWLGCLLDAGPLPYSPLEMDLAEDRITDLLRGAWLPAVVLDLDGRILFLNDALAQLVDQPDHELIYRDFFAAEGNDVPPGATFDPRRTPVAEYPPCFATRLRRRDGVLRVVDWHAMSLRTPCGKIKGVALIGEDNTDERHNEEQLRLTHRVFETTSQAMLITDGQCRILSVNKAFTRLTGYAADEVTGQNPRLLRSGRHDAPFYAQMWQTLNETGHWQGDIWDRRKDGSVYPKFLSISAIRNEGGEIGHYSGIFYDITERKAIEESLDRLANHDSLTGLANRARLQQRLEQAISQALRSGRQVAILYLDLDHFKAINDELGHQAGDDVLCDIAARLVDAVRDDDTVARIGGDEFVVVLPEVQSNEAPARVARKLLAVTASPVVVAGHSVQVTPSIGISLFPLDSQDIDTLLRHADQAMYQVKTRGRNDYLFFAPPDHP